MKNFLTLIAFIFLIGTLHAQDSIFKTNGNIVAAKILEISSTEIKYKKFEFLDGPTYVENKTSIKSIRYANGLKEEFAPQPTQAQLQAIPSIVPPTEAGADYYTKQDTYKQSKLEYRGAYFFYQNRRMGENSAHSMLMQTKDKDIINLVQQSKDAHALKFIGFGAIPLGIGALYFFSQSLSVYGTSVNSGKLAASGLCLIGAIACPIVSGIYGKKRKLYNQQAVKLYNERY